MKDHNRSAFWCALSVLVLVIAVSRCNRAEPGALNKADSLLNEGRVYKP